MAKRWDEDEFSNEKPEDEFWAEYADDIGESSTTEENMLDNVTPDMDDYSIEFREQELEIADKHLNTEILDRAIIIARSNLFWWFFSLERKIKAIKKAYRILYRTVRRKQD